MKRVTKLMSEQIVFMLTDEEPEGACRLGHEDCGIRPTRYCTNELFDEAVSRELRDPSTGHKFGCDCRICDPDRVNDLMADR